MKIRTQLKAGGTPRPQHNETLQVRSTVKAGGVSVNHNETLAVRSSLKAGALIGNHNEALAVRTSLKAGKPRRKTATPTNDRLSLMLVRAGLRAGRRR